MNQENFIRLLQQPESEELEFKSQMPNLNILISNLVAFANTNGGKLIIGIDGRGKIVGIDNIEHASQIVSKAANSILPALKINIQAIEIEGKKVLVVEVPKGDRSPYFAHGQAWQRVGASNSLISSKSLFMNIINRSRSIDDFKTEIGHLSDSVEKLNKDLFFARSWKIKFIDMIIGGIIGAIISLFIALIIRLF